MIWKQSPYYYIEGLEGQFNAFAQAYGCGTYGSGEYDETSCTTGSGSDGSGGLVDTGFGIILAVTIAAILIFVTMLVIVMRRKKKPTSTTSATINATGAKNVQSSAQQPVQKPENTDIINSGKE